MEKKEEEELGERRRTWGKKKKSLVVEMKYSILVSRFVILLCIRVLVVLEFRGFGSWDFFRWISCKIKLF